LVVDDKYAPFQRDPPIGLHDVGGWEKPSAGQLYNE
jgi:hypothetical protein